MKRRAFLSSVPLAAAGVMAVARGEADELTQNADRAACFKADGQFKILAISDLHYQPKPDPYGIALTEKLIEEEKPDLVVATGDNISGDTCSTVEELHRAIGNVAAAMERKKVPWMVTLGNHDQQHVDKTHIGREEVFRLYEQYPYNRNRNRVHGLHGAGNQLTLLWDKTKTIPLYAIWLLDSGEKSLSSSIRYDWIHSDQVDWYCRSSKELEARYGRKIPGLMFFHIPLLEYQQMILTQKVLGERHEPEASSRVNGGLFAAILERRDVQGIFCGHDHVNNYAGKYFGVMMGYNGIAGFSGYPHTPPEDKTNDRARGARVFRVDASDLSRFQTWMRFRDGSIDWEHWSDAYEKDQLK